MPLLRDNGVELARRRSGGGTVYHVSGRITTYSMTHSSAINWLQNGYTHIPISILNLLRISSLAL